MFTKELGLYEMGNVWKAGIFESMQSAQYGTKLVTLEGYNLFERIFTHLLHTDFAKLTQWPPVGKVV